MCFPVSAEQCRLQSLLAHFGVTASMHAVHQQVSLPLLWIASTNVNTVKKQINSVALV